MNLLEILQKELTEFPEGMLYAVQDGDGEVKFGKHSHPTLSERGIWQRRENGKNLTIHRLELAEDWDSAIVTKDMWEKDRVKQIIVNVSGLSVEEKQRVNEALAKIKNIGMCNPMHWDKTDVMYGPSIDGVNVGFDYRKVTNPTHTSQQVLEMAGMAKQGHIHSESMALYAEDAKTTDKPWELWQIKAGSSDWISCKFSPAWDPCCQFRRKPKTHIVHGVEVPDLRFVPKEGDCYWFPDASTEKLVYSTYYLPTSAYDMHRASNNLCYEHTEEGKQAAIMHAKAWLGVA